jgi:probable addiction module antidote protein
MSDGFTRWDVADHLTSDEMIVAYLDACFDEAGDDPALVLICLGDVARARGMPELARDLGTGDANLGTVLAVMKIGGRLSRAGGVSIHNLSADQCRDCNVGGAVRRRACSEGEGATGRRRLQVYFGVFPT